MADDSTHSQKPSRSTTQPGQEDETLVRLHPQYDDETAPAVPPRYEILQEVAKGGMGIVYRARHRQLEMEVAIKVTRRGTRDDRALHERFLREGKLLAQIRSPHVVRVTDYEILPDGAPMLVMDWIAGTDLARHARQQAGPLSETQVLNWMEQTCLGMIAASEHGVIHRDLKPSNILLDGQHKALVADFGLARSGVMSDLSIGGELMGTPHYMAPEQAEDPRGADTRSDIYSFGATFYHLLTKQPPFEGPSVFSVLYKHKTEVLVSPRARNSALSQHTCELLERCLSKTPGDRFASFNEVLQHLHPAQGQQSPWATSDDARLDEYLQRYQSRRELYLNPSQMTEADHYEFPGNRRLTVLRGNLVEQQVDAIVSSDDSDLRMGTHLVNGRGVAGAIRQAAGPQIHEAARAYIPVRPGRAVVTSGGKLPARFVMHAVTMGATSDPNIRPSRDLIQEILSSCLYHADTLHLKSMALPLLGTGVGGFSREVCLDTMFRFLARTFLHGLTPLHDVRIVLF